MSNLTLAILLASVVPGADANLQRFESTGIEMAVPVRIVVYAHSEATSKTATKAAFAKFRELNAVMSDYDPTSEVRRLSATSGSGQAVVVGDDLWRVLCRSKDLAERSGGAFDVTVGPVVRLWRRARRQEELPNSERIAQAQAAVGHKAMELNTSDRTVCLTKPDMWIDLGGIAKGYAIDAALDVLAKHGIRSALVDAGGDIGLSNAPPNRAGWVIGVAPLERDAKPSVFLSLSNVAIATSGDSWQFVEIDGQRYSHLVDPHTGIGLTDHSSVTVIARNAMTADGLASAVSVLGPKEGLQLIDGYEGAAAFVVRAPHGKPETYRSTRWSDYPEVKPAGISPQPSK
jgi:FAD:protein FMN transferase